MFTSILLSKRYWLSVFFVGFSFIIIFSVIEYFMQYSSSTWDTFIEERINHQQWIRYMISRIVGGLIYGMIMGYYFELRKRKSNR
ncbi:hypothetical protein [Aquimarina sp. Aq78]|uniref:hypothetical protein n=1 Tax=Aquimarina sp. Aq78 TaxID=1191889 RepID=UPI00131A92D0|nr:hypothetical protein [Aquimarina sp. Aq78]